MVSNRVPITIRLETFEGPLDLLLYLIQSHEMDISKVAISKITGQYLVYVRLMQELNFDIASEFLVMAATLLLWKSRAVLPGENAEQAGAEEDEGAMSQEELLRQLLEHQRFLAMGEDLARLPRLGEQVFGRPGLKPPVERVWREMNVTDLALGYQDSLARERRRSTVLRKETVSLSGKIEQFARMLRVGRPSSLRSLMSESPSRAEVVVTFLASLELARLTKLKVFQDEVYGPILVELIEEIGDLELKLATGFDAIGEMAAGAPERRRRGGPALLRGARPGRGFRDRGRRGGRRPDVPPGRSDGGRAREKPEGARADRRGRSR